MRMHVASGMTINAVRLGAAALLLSAVSSQAIAQSDLSLPPGAGVNQPQFAQQPFPGQQFPGQFVQQFPGQQFPGQQFPGQPFPGQPFPGQQFQGQQFVQPFPGQFQQQQFTNYQQFQVLPAPTNSVTNARGVTIASEFAPAQPVRQLPGNVTGVTTGLGTQITSGNAGLQADRNVFTGQILPGLPFVGVDGNLPLVDEDYERLDTDGVIRSGSLGQGQTRTGRGRSGKTEFAGFTPGQQRGNAGTFTGGQGSGTVAAAPAATGNTGTVSRTTGGRALKPGVRPSLPSRKPSGIGRGSSGTTAVASVRSPAGSQAASATAGSQPVLVRRSSTPATGAATRPAATSPTPSNSTTTFVSGGALNTLSTGGSRPATPAAGTQTASVQPANTQPPAATTASPADPRLISIIFPQTSSSLPAQARTPLERLSERMKADEGLRIQLLSYASAGESSTSARRLSLSRALAVRSFLIAQGIDQSRMIVRAEGDKNNGGQPDRLDIVTVN